MSGPGGIRQARADLMVLEPSRWAVGWSLMSTGLIDVSEADALHTVPVPAAAVAGLDGDLGSAPGRR